MKCDDKEQRHVLCVHFIQPAQKIMGGWGGGEIQILKNKIQQTDQHVPWGLL
jgi:hypothetical protein